MTERIADIKIEHVIVVPNIQQIAFDNGDTWSIICGHVRLSGYTATYPMPAVTCPVIDTRGIKSDGLMRQAMLEYVKPGLGCLDVPGLCNRLEELGGKVNGGSHV